MKKLFCCLLLLPLLCCAVTSLAGEEQAPAAQWQAGDLTFVPSIREAEPYGLWVTVKGRSLTQEGAVQEIALPGVVLEVWVKDAQGELIPWADPHNPAKAYAITSGEAPVFLSLPQGVQCYLVQSTTPEGYFPMQGDAPIALNPGVDLTVLNVQRGQLMVRATDAGGAALGGAQIRLTQEEGGVMTFDIPSEGSLLCKDMPSGLYTVEVLSAPGGFLMPEQDTYQLEIADARATRLDLSFAPMGSVSVTVSGRALDENGVEAWVPLSGVEIALLDGKGKALQDENGSPVALVTGESGGAMYYLAQGEYRLSVPAMEKNGYTIGEKEISFQIEDGLVVRETLEALSTQGGVAVSVVSVEAGQGAMAPLSGATYTISTAQGELLTQGAVESDGKALVTGLTAGEYLLSVQPPEGYALETESAVVFEIAPAALAEVQVRCPVLSAGTLTLSASIPGEDTTLQQQALAGVEFAVHRDETIVAQGKTDDKGQTSLNLPVGEYGIAFADNQAVLEDFDTADVALEWNGGRVQVVLPHVSGRLMLRSLGTQEERLTGAVYQLSGGGKSLTLTADARGEAVTPLLPAGEYTLTTSASPDRYAEARQQVEVTANAVQVIPVQHVPLGEVSITVYESSVNSAGDATQNVLAGQQVEIHAVDARGNAGERVYADNTLASNRSGLVRDEKDLLPALPEGVYRVSAAGISVDVQIRDAMRTEAQLSVPSETGALRILVKDSIGVQAPLAGARFVLHGATGDEVTLTTGEDGTALVTMLAAGNYSLEQTRAPAGYSGIPQRQVTIAGGELVELEVQNHAYATLRVIKRGISYTAEGTPTQEELSGEYTLYYKLDDMILPYEEDGQPVRVLAGEAVSLPATPAGMTYILREVSKPTPGYLAGEAEPSVALKSGQATDLQVALVADQGFLRVENADASTGAGLSGARFGLYAVQNEKEAAEPTLVFGVQDGVYINEKPLPTGAYVLRMVSAASGYMLDEAVHPIRWDVQIEAISPEAKNIAEVETRSAAIPAEQTTDSARALSVEPAQLASLYEGEQSLRMRLSAADGSSTLPLDDYAVEIGGMMLESGGEWISAEENGDFAWYVTRVTLHPATDQSGKPVTASLWAQGWLGGWREVQDSLDLSEAVMLDLSDEDGGAFTWLRSVRIEYESHDGGVAAGFSGGEIEVEVRLARRYAGMAALSAVQPVASERFAVQYLDEKGRAAHGPQQQADVYGGQLAVAGGEAQPYTTAPDEGKAVLTGRLLMDLEGQAGETGAPGYLVRLKDDDGGIAAQAVSYNGGYYTLEAAPGTYQVEVVAPVASFAQTVLEEVALEAGQTRTADLSVARSTLVRLALVDQTGEPAQLSVALVAADGAEHEAVWSEEGLAVWQSLPLGDYTLRIELPDALMLDKPEWQGAQVQLTTQQWYMDLRVVVRPAAGVRGSLFSDIDGSGTQDAGESGLSGVQVRLLTDLVSQAQPKEVASLTTGGDGSFSFEKLAAGTYALEYTLPAGMVLPQGATQQGTAWRGEAFTLEEGAQETLAAVAAVRPGQLSGSVWLDSDHNGLFEAGETPEEGFVVRLYDLSSDSSLPVQSVKTDDQGAYTFTGLMPGTYQIRVSLSEDRVPTKWVQDGNQLSKTQERAAQTEPIVLRMDETPPKILLGLSIPVELTVFSWLDEQYTGQVSRTAQGIAQVQWELIAQGQEEAGESVSTAVSDASGEAVFTDLGPGVYKLRYVLPEGYYPSIAVDGAIRSEQEQWQSQGETRYFTLSANQAEQRLTFGLMQPVSISGTVWLDADDNALLDAGEAGYAGAVVVALDESGQAAAQAESGADGTYTLSPLSPGRYTVRVTAPEGYVFSGAERSYTRGSVARSDSNISQTMQLELRPQTPLSGIDAGVMPLGSLSGKVVSDEDASQGLGGARVSLEQVVDGVAASTMEAQSAQDGSFAFAALRPGSYRLRIELPGGNVLVRYPERLTLESGVYSSVSQFEVFAFSPGETLEGLEFSGLVLCTLGGYAFDDQNSDGLRNEGEAALRGMTVELLSAGQGAQQEVLANTSTGADGAFSFVGLLPGTYALRVTLPSDRVFTNAAEGGSLPQRSDVQVAYLPSVELSRGQSRMDQIVGALQLAEVSGQVFLDTSDDGRMQSEEQGLSGVLVQAVGKDGTLHAEATSDSVGSWRISGLEPGEYTLRATLPDGQVFARTATREGTPYFTMQDNAEGVSTLFTLSFGQSVRGVHIGAVTTGGIAGRMYDETLEDAAANGIAGAQVTLTNLAGGQTYTQETGDDGVFRLEGLRPGKWSLSIALPGERLFSLNTTTWFGEIEQSSTATVEPLTLGMGQWMENFQIGTLLPVRVAGSVYLDADKSLSRGAEEKGLPGVTVQLIREGQVVAQALTASDGNFAFEKLRPGLLGLSVQIPSQAMLEQGGPLDLAEGSDTTGTLTQRMLNAGEAIESLDIPALQRGLISGMVYEDLNTNGLFDLGEPSIQNVRVDLIDNAQESQILMTQQVDENGRYSFTSLPPGEYTLRFTLPHGYLLAETQDDAAPSQVGMLPPVSLGMGESQTGVQMRAIQTGHIGDTVWIDANGNGLQDDGELPYEGLEIVLYRVQEGAMTEVSRTLSDQYGFYHFNDLYPGTYQVEAVLPEGFAFTGRNENLTEITTAITQIDEKRGFTETFPLESGRHLRSIDIGLMQ